VNDISNPAVVFADVLERVNAIAREVVAPNAEAVDRDARFPREAFDALKAEKLLSAYVPVEYGGMGFDIAQIARVCEILGQHCASTAMIFAMHQIQVACIVHHALGSAYFRDYAREIVKHQYLLASATTELGIGGDLRQSICAAKVVDGGYILEKQAPVISYGEAADAILITCRRGEDAARSDQVQVLARKEDYTLKPLSTWNTLGFRGTCSPGFVVKSMGHADAILPTPFATILSKTMHPYSHIVWGSLWCGLATDALNRAKSVVRNEARKNPAVLPISATRLAEADVVLFAMKSGLQATTAEYRRMLAEESEEAFTNFGFSIRINDLKLACSQQVIDVVGRAMMVCGIAGYRNDSKTTLGRHLRDAYGAGLMVNNDRILGHNATMHIGQREG
jgi:acyl-CoA dehydrogenase